jgi:hypothetical protein
LDLALSDKDELLKLIGSLFRKLQSYPHITSIFVVEYTVCEGEERRKQKGEGGRREEVKADPERFNQ